MRSVALRAREWTTRSTCWWRRRSSSKRLRTYSSRLHECTLSSQWASRRHKRRRACGSSPSGSGPSGRLMSGRGIRTRCQGRALHLTTSQPRCTKKPRTPHAPRPFHPRASPRQVLAMHHATLIGRCCTHRDTMGRGLEDKLALAIGADSFTPELQPSGELQELQFSAMAATAYSLATMLSSPGAPPALPSHRIHAHAAATASFCHRRSRPFRR